MKIVVTPKKEVKGNAQFYGEAFGMTAIVSLTPGQVWDADFRKGYWTLRRKGKGVELRLTETAMNRMFEEAKQE